jgi:sortase A
MFGLFNERFIAPFITPSKSVSNTPIIIDPSTTAVGPEPKVIIPKINVEIPIVFDEESTEEAAIQRALEEGVIHYATTSNPGEQGNGAIFGHSSNNILNKGKYKFAFVLLRRLESGDVFYVQKDGKRFAYRVYKKTVVSPDQVAVLGAQDKPSTMSLITCDPPGTSLNRLVVVGEQISPDPSTNVASTANQETTSPAILPSNSPSLWSRLTSWLSS